MKSLLSVLALSLLVSATAFADSSKVLARVTVCPQDKSFLKSETVTLTNDTIRFDVVSGPLRIAAGAPAAGTLVYKVSSIRNIGVINRGLEVKFESEDSVGQVINTIRIFADSTDDVNNGKLSANDYK
jgi:hypothetical protein